MNQTIKTPDVKEVKKNNRLHILALREAKREFKILLRDSGV